MTFERHATTMNEYPCAKRDWEGAWLTGIHPLLERPRQGFLDHDRPGSAWHQRHSLSVTKRIVHVHPAMAALRAHLHSTDVRDISGKVVPEREAKAAMGDAKAAIKASIPTARKTDSVTHRRRRG